LNSLNDASDALRTPGRDSQATEDEKRHFHPDRCHHLVAILPITVPDSTTRRQWTEPGFSRVWYLTRKTGGRAALPCPTAFGAEPATLVSAWLGRPRPMWRSATSPVPAAPIALMSAVTTGGGGGRGAGLVGGLAAGGVES
jgi:hypothetical protein